MNRLSNKTPTEWNPTPSHVADRPAVNRLFDTTLALAVYWVKGDPHTALSQQAAIQAAVHGKAHAPRFGSGRPAANRLSDN